MIVFGLVCWDIFCELKSRLVIRQLMVDAGAVVKTTACFSSVVVIHQSHCCFRARKMTHLWCQLCNNTSSWSIYQCRNSYGSLLALLTWTSTWNHLQGDVFMIYLRRIGWTERHVRYQVWYQQGYLWYSSSSLHAFHLFHVSTSWRKTACLRVTLV